MEPLRWPDPPLVLFGILNFSFAHLLNHMEVNTAPPAYEQDKIAERKDLPLDEEGQLKSGEVHDAFGNEEYAEIKYKTLKWWYVSSIVGNRVSYQPC